MIINYELSPNSIGSDGDDDDTNLMIIFCIAVLTILSIICICTLYCCLRKYVFFKPINKTISPFAALSKKAFQPVIHSLTSDQNVVECSTKAVSETKKRPDAALPAISRGRRAKPSRGKGANSCNAQGGKSSYNTQVSHPLDKGSITADMFTPIVNANLKKEMILFKAPSFNE